MYVRGLNAKIYMSDRGLVVASANASNRGIGFVQTAGLTECGTLHRSGTRAFRDAAIWFERLWNEKSKQVGPKALNDACRAWAQRRRHEAPDPRPSTEPETMLRRLAADPVTYRGIGVVFSTGEAERDDVIAASAAAFIADAALPQPKLSDDDRARLSDWDEHHLFTGRSDAEASAWPKRFLCVHRGVRGAVSYWCNKKFADARLGSHDWSVFAAPSHTVRTKLALGTRHRQAAGAEDELLAKIFALRDAEVVDDDGGPHRLCESPVHLAELLRIVDEIA